MGQGDAEKDLFHRGSAGDAKFTMTVSILSMWFVRIALAYLIGVSLHVGLLGVWIAQTLDWVVRAGFLHCPVSRS